MTRCARTGGNPFACVDIGGLYTTLHAGQNEGQSEHLFHGPSPSSESPIVFAIAR
jgi:hypothetical protein